MAQKQLEEFKHFCHTFAKDTSLHGLQNATKQRISTFKHIIWIFILCGMTALSTYLLTESVTNYLKFRTLTVTHQTMYSQLDFPTLKICNFNKKRDDKVNELYPEIAKFHDLFHRLVIHSSDIESTINSFEWNSLKTRMAPLLKNISLNQYKMDSGYSMEETFVSCMEGTMKAGFNCTRFVLPYVHLDDACYTFHAHDIKKANPIQVTDTGVLGGISMVLNVSPNDYSNVTSNPGYGFYLDIYDSEQILSDDSSPVALSRGFHTTIGIEIHERNILSKPYANENCIPDKHYTRTACIEACRKEKLFNSLPNCTCDASYGNSDCTLYDLYYCVHVFILTSQWNEWKYCEQCRHPCSHTFYVKEISSATFPNDAMVLRAQTENWPIQNKSAIHDNYASVHVYYRSFAKTSTTEKPKMTASDLFGNIGGQLGLCIGASLITIFEFVEFISDACLFLCKRRKQRVSQQKI